MIRALVIGDAERAVIDAAVRRARRRPTTLAELEDIVAGRRKVVVESIDLPGGYEVAFSFEHQQIGLCRHLSVAVDRPGFLPNMLAVGMIAEAFGFVTGMDRRFWLEEFKPGHSAVNVVEPVAPDGSETKQ